MEEEADYNEEVRPDQTSTETYARPHILNVAHWHIPHSFKHRYQHYLRLSQSADIYLHVLSRVLCVQQAQQGHPVVCADEVLILSVALFRPLMYPWPVRGRHTGNMTIPTLKVASVGPVSSN